MSTGSGMVGELVATTGNLVDVIGREVAAIKAGRMADVEELQPDKSRLAGAFESLMRRLKADPAMFSAVEPPLKEEIRDALHRLEVALAGNERTIAGARAANERLVRSIARAADEEQRRDGPYGRLGNAPARGREPVAFALDQRF